MDFFFKVSSATAANKIPEHIPRGVFATILFSWFASVEEVPFGSVCPKVIEYLGHHNPFAQFDEDSCQLGYLRPNYKRFRT
jgi:hypothetical protein